jgi:pimeloyl-ACP methyl ester carboxylesterase
MWRRLMPELAADGFRVLCPDLRGLGWSGSPADRDFRKRRLVEDACALLDELGIASTAVLGHDWGGWVAFLLARRHPERVSRLLGASIAAPWRNARPGPGDVAFAYQPLIGAPKLGPALVRRPGFLAAMMRAATARAFEWPPGELEAFTTVTSAPKAALASSLYYRQFLTRELSGVRRGGGDRADGDRLEMPVLQLVGTEDVVLRRVAPPPVAAAGWRLEVVPGCGHFLFDEQPDFALARTRAFLVGG